MAHIRYKKGSSYRKSALQAAGYKPADTVGRQPAIANIYNNFKGLNYVFASGIVRDMRSSRGYPSRRFNGGRLCRRPGAGIERDRPQVVPGSCDLFFHDPSYARPAQSIVEVCLRLGGKKDQVASIFRLDTNYGGGKTHALIALAHVARGMQGVATIDEFLSPALVPSTPVHVAAFDGENADPVNGHAVGDGIRAYTPWGEIAYALGGAPAYNLIRNSDEKGIAPGADTIKELFGEHPTLILIDELSIYLRKQGARDLASAAKQLTAFLTALFKAVESSPNAALVYTLAIGKKDKKASDAYSQENQIIADMMQEAESVSARKATLLDPTEEDETIKVLRRRLFAHIDAAGAKRIVDAYARLWEQNKESLPSFGLKEKHREAFYEGFPLHPEMIATLKEKTSTLGNFQRVRGMLRLLARTISRLWEQKPKDTYAVHLHHIDLSFSPIRQEIITKLGQQAFVPALKADIAAAAEDTPFPCGTDGRRILCRHGSLCLMCCPEHFFPYAGLQ